MRNHNNLLGHIEGVDGIKTGYTQASGFNLVTSVHRNNRYIVAVVLGGASAGERDARMRALIETHIALASTNHTATAIAQAVGAKTEKRTAEAKAVAPSGESTPTYAVASFAPQAAWPELKFVPAAPAADVPTAALTAAEMAAAASASETPPLIPKPAALVDVNDTVKPVQVKTIKAKLTQIQTAGHVGPPEPAPIATQPPAPKTTAVTAVTAAPMAPGTALREPIPTAALPTKVPASASTSSVAATPLVPHASEADASVSKRSVAAQSARTHAGWIVQIGAFDIEREAQRQLSSAHVKAGHVLDKADPFTEAVVKGDKTFYRARFAGFQQRDEAETACKQLKLRDIDCITIKN
jgi:D-alanyl-D-alanine carboxypeptidase